MYYVTALPNFRLVHLPAATKCYCCLGGKGGGGSTSLSSVSHLPPLTSPTMTSSQIIVVINRYICSSLGSSPGNYIGRWHKRFGSLRRTTSDHLPFFFRTRIHPPGKFPGPSSSLAIKGGASYNGNSSSQKKNFPGGRGVFFLLEQFPHVYKTHLLVFFVRTSMETCFGN